MMIENEMIHGRLPRARAVRQAPPVCSHIAPASSPSPLRKGRGLGRGVRSLVVSTHPPPPEHEAWGEWDLSARLCKEIEPPRARIENDTPIVPIAIAVWEEASLWLDAGLPRSWIAELAERGNVIYAHNPRFRQLIRRPGNASRDWLWAFTRHWLSALLASRRPELRRRLPASYAVGRDLPPPPQ
jgi:hypothetical protein